MKEEIITIVKDYPKSIENLTKEDRRKRIINDVALVAFALAGMAGCLFLYELKLSGVLG